MRNVWAALFGATVILLAAACGSDASSNGNGGTADAADTTGPGLDTADGQGGPADAPDVPTARTLSVDTAVDPNAIGAGESAAITCTATDDKGLPVTDVAFEIIVVPTVGARVDGTTFTAETTGTYEVRCRALPEGPADTTPAMIAVGPGAPAAITATIAPAEVPAGTPAQVTCALVDGFGNTVSVTAWELAVPETVTIQGMAVSATVAGEYEVACHRPGVDETGLTNTPATLTVVPGEPTEIVLVATPARDWYALNAQVTITYEVRDAHGNPRPDLDYGPLTLTVTPPAGLTPMGADKYKFEATGVYAVHGTVAGPPAAEADLTLVCDPDPPTVDVTAPERGLTLNGTAAVTVEGTASDAVTGLATLTVNGTAVAVGEGGTFTAPVTLHQGMNVITVHAEDGAGHAAETLRAVYFSTVWYAADPAIPGSAEVQDALDAHASKEFFYSEDTTKTTVSGIVGQLLASLDLGALVPQPATVTKLPLCGQDSTVWVSDVHYAVPGQMNLGTEANPRLYGNPLINVTDGGLHVAIALTDFSAHMKIETPGGGLTCLNTEGRVYADRIMLIADIDLALDAGGQVNATVRNVSVRIDGLSNDLSGITGALVNLLSEWVEEYLVGMVEDLVVEQLADVLSGLTQVLAFETDLDLDPFIGEGAPVTLHLATRLTRLELKGTDPGSGVHMTAAAAITTPRVVDRVTLGSIGRASCLGAPETFALPQVGDIEVGIFDDALNEALYGLWAGGLLDLVITEETLGDTDLSSFGLTDLNVETRPLLPPIATSCTEDGALVAQVGDFWLHATFGLFGQPVDLTAYLYLEVALNLVSTTDEDGKPAIGIEIGEMRFVEADIVALNDESKRTTLEGLLEGALPDLALAQLADGPITFTIPPIDLGSLAEGTLPEGVLLQIVVDAITRTMGYTVATGHIEPGVPEPPVE